MSAAAAAGQLERPGGSADHAHRIYLAVAVAVAGGIVGVAGESSPCCAGAVTLPLVQRAAVPVPGPFFPAMLVARESSSFAVD